MRHDWSRFVPAPAWAAHPVVHAPPSAGQERRARTAFGALHMVIARAPRRTTMSWRNTTLSHLSAMMLSLGAFAGTAAAQRALGDFTDQGDVGRVSHPGSA